MGDPVVLVGMSVREVAGARPAARRSPREHGATVAFLQVGDPSLSRELTRLADAGAERVVLVGVSLGTLAPAVSWLRRIAAHWWRERPGHRPDGRGGHRACVEDPGEVPGRPRRDSAPVTGTEAGLTSAAWEDVHRAPAPGAGLPGPALHGAGLRPHGRGAHPRADAPGAGRRRRAGHPHRLPVPVQPGAGGQRPARRRLVRRRRPRRRPARSSASTSSGAARSRPSRLTRVRRPDQPARPAIARLGWPDTSRGTGTRCESGAVPPL